jgi:hypothetical protein
MSKNSLNATSFIGGGINVVRNTTTISPADSGDLTYLNTNKTLKADTITIPDTATFEGTSILQPGNTSILPPTTADNFTVFINGQYIPPSSLSIAEGGNTVVIVFNTTLLGYELTEEDEVVAIGKFS